MNLGPLRQKGVELSIEHRFDPALTGFANYSWQGEPEILDDPNPYPVVELPLPPTNRFNLGMTYNGPPVSRLPLAELHGLGVLERRPDQPVPRVHRRVHDGERQLRQFRWNDGRVTTSIKSTNLFNETIQQHIFGDLLRRSVTAEVRFDF